MLYALSTCGWCRKTKELLDSGDVDYDYVYVDRCAGDERNEVARAVRELNPRGSFPTIKIDDHVVVGFDEDRIRELLGL
jgi:glutaredoxin